MARQLFSRDPFLGLTKYFHYDEGKDQAIIETVADVEPLLEANLQSRNEQTRLDRMGDGVQHVACVPMHIYGEWLATGKDRDDAFVRRWLNDPENLKYRTFRCKV